MGEEGVEGKARVKTFPNAHRGRPAVSQVYVLVPRTHECGLIWKESADEIELRTLRCIIQVSPEAITGVLREQRELRHRHRRGGGMTVETEIE